MSNGKHDKDRLDSAGWSVVPSASTSNPNAARGVDHGSQKTLEDAELGDFFARTGLAAFDAPMEAGREFDLDLSGGDSASAAVAGSESGDEGESQDATVGPTGSAATAASAPAFGVVRRPGTPIAGAVAVRGRSEGTAQQQPTLEHIDEALIRYLTGDHPAVAPQETLHGADSTRLGHASDSSMDAAAGDDAANPPPVVGGDDELARFLAAASAPSGAHDAASSGFEFTVVGDDEAADADDERARTVFGAATLTVEVESVASIAAAAELAMSDGADAEAAFGGFDSRPGTKVGRTAEPGDSVSHGADAPWMAGRGDAGGFGDALEPGAAADETPDDDVWADEPLLAGGGDEDAEEQAAVMRLVEASFNAEAVASDAAPAAEVHAGDAAAAEAEAEAGADGGASQTAADDHAGDDDPAEDADDEEEGFVVDAGYYDRVFGGVVPAVAAGEPDGGDDAQEAEAGAEATDDGRSASASRPASGSRSSSESDSTSDSGEVPRSTAPPQPPVGGRSDSGEVPAYFTGAYPTAPSGAGGRSLQLTPMSVDTAAPEISMPEVEGGVPDDGWAVSFDAFREEAQRLARAKRWRRLAATTAWAIVHAPYAVGGTRTGMLVDLARVYRDRLGDLDAAEEAFRAALVRAPDDVDALQFLADRLAARGDHAGVYGLYRAAVAATWDPDLRFRWASEAAALAADELRDSACVVEAWEWVALSADADAASKRALTAAYRRAGRWGDLAAFLGATLGADAHAPGVLYRELAEIELSGNRAPEAAASILERFVGGAKADPIATQQLARIYAQTENWDALARLGGEGVVTLSAEQAQARRGHIAELLWDAGRQEEAARLYAAMLDVDATLSVARDRVHAYLENSGQHEALMAALAARVDATSDAAERLAGLRRAAHIAHDALGDVPRAIALREKALALDASDLAGWRALVELYAEVGDHAGMAHALEALCVPGRVEPGERTACLRRLATTYTDALGDRERAIVAWREVLRLDPTDDAARDVLMELYRAASDYESLHTALMRRIAATRDAEVGQRLARMAAANLDAHVDDAARSAEAWLRVLDYAPRTADALANAAARFGTLGALERQVLLLEQQVVAEPDPQRRTALTLQIAEIWESGAMPRRAAAAYERALHWDRRHELALASLAGLYVAADRTDLALAAYDQAVGGCSGPSEIAALLRRSLSLLGADAVRERFERTYRVHRLDPTDTAVVDELLALGAQIDEPEEVVALLTSVLAETADAASRTRLSEQRATVLRERCESPDRAYLAAQAALFAAAEDDAALAPLRTLAEETGRWEDLLALLDTRTSSAFDAATRRAMIRERASILEARVGSPLRAFLELRRLLENDPRDWEPVNELGRLAHEHGLWRPLVAVLTVLGDACADDDERAQLAMRIEAIGRGPLGDARLAFAQAMRLFRLDRGRDTSRAQFAEDVAALDEWDWALPVFEAADLADVAGCGGAAATARLVELAGWYEERGRDADRAFGLLTLAVAEAPDDAALSDRVTALAGVVRRHDDLALTLRRAAALTSEPPRAAALLRAAADVYEETLARPDDAIDLHRRLLELDDADARSLAVMIDANRRREQWHDLRDGLQRAAELAAEDTGRVEALLEIAAISEERLEDTQRALSAYGAVLAVDPLHPVALARVEAIVSLLDDPRQLLEFRQQEAARAEGAARVALDLAVANLQAERLGDAPGAIETLRAVVAREGVESAAFEPLEALLVGTGQTVARVELLAARAAAVADPDEKRARLQTALREAVRCDDVDDAAREGILVALLALDPDDVALYRQRAQILRLAGRYAELAEVLGDAARKVSDAGERAELQRERARLLFTNLGQPDAAVAAWEAMLRDQPGDASLLLALAGAAQRRGDIDTYIAMRRAQAQVLAGEDAAYVLCHLAEVCDEYPAHAARVADFYREARRVSPQCEPAKLALTAIGRRKKELRPEAALLAEAGERELTWAARGERLVALARAAGREASLDLLRRAAATAPDLVEVWSALADAAASAGLAEAAHRARLAALDAQRRSVPLDAAALDAEATQLLAIAESSRALGHVAEYERILRRLHTVAPGHAPTAVAAARLHLDRGEAADAVFVLDALIARGLDALPPRLRAEALYGRARAALAQGRVDAARDDLKAALRAEPLHAEALRAFAEVEAARGQTAVAVEHLIRALVTEDGPEERAALLFQMGVLWEDGLGDTREAGACYELARGEGLASRELMVRVLRHYQRSGALERGLEVVDSLLDASSDDPAELASLWFARGEILAGHAGREDDAIEAFDMALSYDPDLHRARLALAGVLERRGDWDGLLQLLEAITESDTGVDEDRAHAYFRMASIAEDRLADVDRAESYLRASLAAAPSAEARARLLGRVGARSYGSDEHRALLAAAVADGPPWYAPALTLGEVLLGEDPAWAWCLLSPALVIRGADDGLKGRLREMRREYERPPIRVAVADEATGYEALLAILAEVEARVPVGRTAVSEVTSEGATVVSVHSNVGKTFAAFASQRGLGSVALHRAADVAAPLAVINDAATPAVVVRADVFQQLARAEIGFVIAAALTWMRPGVRGVMACDAAERGAWIEGLWAATGLRDAVSADGAKRADQLRDAAPLAQLADWAERLTPFATDAPADVAVRLHAALVAQGHRAGLVAGADLVQVLRLVSKLDGDAERPAAFDDAAAFDAYLASSPGLAPLVAFAASAAFGAALRGAQTL